jgi:hypothetical protein
MSFFLHSANNHYSTTARNIILARRFFSDNPNGHIETGIPQKPYWNKTEFNNWFNDSLGMQTALQPFSISTLLFMSEYCIIKNLHHSNLLKK